MSDLNIPVCQETFIHVLREVAKHKDRDNFKVIYGPNNPHELIICIDDIKIVYPLPRADVDVPEELLRHICRKYTIPMVFFIYPGAINI